MVRASSPVPASRLQWPQPSCTPGGLSAPHPGGEYEGRYMTTTFNPDAAANDKKRETFNPLSQFESLQLDTAIPEAMLAFAGTAVMQSREAYERAKATLDAGVECSFGALIGLAGLHHRRAGKGAHGLRNGGIQLQAFELRQGVEGLPLFVVGGSIGIEGFGHISTLVFPARMRGLKPPGGAGWLGPLQARGRNGR